MGPQEAEMLHRFRLVEGTKTTDRRRGGNFEIEQVFEREFFEAGGFECRELGAGERPRAMTSKRPPGLRKPAMFSMARGGVPLEEPGGCWLQKQNRNCHAKRGAVRASWRQGSRPLLRESVCERREWRFRKCRRRWYEIPKRQVVEHRRRVRSR